MTKLKLFTLLGNYPNAQALKSGAVKSDLVEFDFADVKVSNTAFKPLVREAKFDVAEFAIVTFLQAKTYGKPYVLIPATVLGRGQHHTIAYNPERGPLKASDLAGKRVGVRAYTVTTGAWVRGFLADDYGVDPPRSAGSPSRTRISPNTRTPISSPARRRARSWCRCCSTASSTRRSSATSCPIRGSSRSFPMPRRRRANGPKRMAACRSTIWWWCARRSPKSGRTWCKEHLPRAAGEPQCCLAAAGRPARSVALRRRGQPALARDHHRLQRAAEADPARFTVDELFEA